MRRSPWRSAQVCSSGLLLGFLACNPSAPHQDTSVEGASRSCTSVPAPELARSFEQVDHLLDTRVDEQGIPGVAAGVICGPDLAWAKGYGVMALDNPQSVTSRTRFRIASLTKLFTATAVMVLRERGDVALNEPAERYVPWLATVGRPVGTGTTAITVRQLLTHTSGMPRDSRLTDFGRLFQPDRAQAIAALSSQRLQEAPGERFAYSNLGYGVLGELIAAVSGQSYAHFLEQEVFAALGMTETLVHPTPDDDVAWGHAPRRSGGSRSKAGFWDLRFATPAGGMASSVEELSNFIALHLTPYTGDPPAIVSAAALREMHQTHYVVDPDRGGVGLGWAVETSHGQHVIYHGGELPEQTSFVLLDLRSHIGVVALTNAQDANASEMAQAILRIVRSVVFDSTAWFPAQAIPPE